MKDSVEKKDFIYKLIKYSDNEVISKIKKLEDINSKSITRSVKDVAYRSLFI